MKNTKEKYTYNYSFNSFRKNWSEAMFCIELWSTTYTSVCVWQHGKKTTFLCFSVRVCGILCACLCSSRHEQRAFVLTERKEGDNTVLPHTQCSTCCCVCSRAVHSAYFFKQFFFFSVHCMQTLCVCVWHTVWVFVFERVWAARF